jgi:hypothetical protein
MTNYMQISPNEGLLVARWTYGKILTFGYAFLG